ATPPRPTTPRSARYSNFSTRIARPASTSPRRWRWCRVHRSVASTSGTRRRSTSGLAASGATSSRTTPGARAGRSPKRSNGWPSTGPRGRPPPLLDELDAVEHGLSLALEGFVDDHQQLLAVTRHDIDDFWLACANCALQRSRILLRAGQPDAVVGTANMVG